MGVLDLRVFEHWVAGVQRRNAGEGYYCFNSNITGGSVLFKRMIHQASALASAEKRRKLNDVLKMFKSNTPGIHGDKLDQLIDEWGSEGVAR